MPGLLDETIKLMKHFHKKGTFDLLPMTPQKLPFQIISIGELLIVTYPHELTTMAGKRLKTFIKSRIDESEFSEVLISPYSNGYNGYITTPEEYQIQEYEGGHTAFGQWSLYALFQITDKLLTEFAKKSDKRSKSEDVLSQYDNLDIELLMY